MPEQLREPMCDAMSPMCDAMCINPELLSTIVDMYIMMSSHQLVNSDMWRNLGFYVDVRICGLPWWQMSTRVPEYDVWVHVLFQ